MPLPTNVAKDAIRLLPASIRNDPKLKPLLKSPEMLERAFKLAMPDTYAEERLGIKLHPKQAAVLRDLFKPQSRVAFCCSNEVGKGVSCNELLPTDSGWKTMGEIAVGDRVIGGDGKLCNVVYVSQVSQLRCYRVTFSDGQSLVTDNVHLWETWYCEPNGIKSHGECTSKVIMSTEQVRDTLRYKKGKWSGAAHHVKTVRCQLESVPMPFPAYALGVWLGNGATGSGTITCHQSDKHWFTTALAGEGFNTSWRDDKRSKATSSTILGALCGLRSLGVLDSKYIPPAYLRASDSDREALLAGLMDTDGYADKRGQCEFCTTTKALADGTMELLWTLGYKPVMTEGRSVLRGKDHGPKWRIAFRATKANSPFRSPRKRDRLPDASKTERPADRRYIVSIEPVPTVPTKCIQVDSPDECYLAGRGFIKTHNTRVVVTAAVLFAIERLKAQVVSTAGVFRQISEQLIPSLKRFAPLFDKAQFQFLDKAIKVSAGPGHPWFDRYIGFSVQDGNFFQGFHKDENMPLLVIIDEGQSVDDTVFQSAEDRCNPTYFLVCGSPADPAGMFYRMQTDLAKFYTNHKLTRPECLTTNGYWVRPEEIDRIVAKYGRENPFVKSTVFGEFSELVEGALLSLGEFDRCMVSGESMVWNKTDRHAFCDFAAGGDKNVLAVRWGNKVWIEKKWVDTNTMSAVGEFITLFKKLNHTIGLEAHEISGDADGLGGPMVQRIKEVGWNINAFHGGAAPRFEYEAASYKNAVTEAWGQGADMIKRSDIILPFDLEFKGQLLGRKSIRHSNGFLEMETKKEMKKRGLCSPDEADGILGAMMPCGSWNTQALSSSTVMHLPASVKPRNPFSSFL